MAKFARPYHPAGYSAIATGRTDTLRFSFCAFWRYHHGKTILGGLNENHRSDH
jgi:hypothetical protein